MNEPSPEFLGGAEGVVLTDTREFPLVVVIGWDGACDITCKLPKPQAADLLRRLADSLDEADVDGAS